MNESNKIWCEILEYMYVYLSFTPVHFKTNYNSLYRWSYTSDDNWLHVLYMHELTKWYFFKIKLKLTFVSFSWVIKSWAWRIILIAICTIIFLNYFPIDAVLRTITWKHWEVNQISMRGTFHLPTPPPPPPHPLK